MSASPPTAVKDRRRFRRIPRSRETALFRYEDENGKPTMARGRLENISGGGAALQAKGPPPPGTLGELTIQFQGFKIVSESRVVRHTPRGFSVEFTDLDDVLRESILDLPDDADADDLQD